VLHPIALTGAPSEMAPMLAALNGLFERIAALIESERRFTADAAHELRTPIAAIRAQAQVALGEADDALRRHALLSTLEGCDRATRLVEQLLTLSRLEAGAAPPVTPLDLSALVRSVAAELAPRAIQKRQTIAVDALVPCQVHGDATLLAVLVRNLVDNAIRYSPPNATIKVAVRGQQTQIRLKVEDSGPGMTGPDMQRMGERFFRVMGSNESGSGLGWSIVRRIATVHQASVSVDRSVDLGGLAVEVDLPAQS
jgi:two-component system sensor histidine kinase QseC